MGLFRLQGDISFHQDAPDSVCWKECRLVYSLVSSALAGASLPITGIKKEHWFQIQRISTWKLISAFISYVNLGKLLRETVSLSQDFSTLTLLTFWAGYFFSMRRGCPAHCTAFSSITSSTSPPAMLCLPRPPLGQNCPWLRTTGLSVDGDENSVCQSIVLRCK